MKILKWIWAVLIVVILTVPISAKVLTAKKDGVAFKSVELMISCMAQAEMENMIPTRDAFRLKAAIYIPEGTKINILSINDGVYMIAVDGVYGVWFTTPALWGKEE